jgi:hypothetical protein
VTDDKRKGLGKIVDGISGGNDRLRLKGRVYVRHIRRVEDSSSPSDGELSLTITMEDDALDKFVMTFKDRQALDVWKAQIESLVEQHRRSDAKSTSSPEATPKIGSERDQMVLPRPPRHGSVREQRSNPSVRDSIASSSAMSSTHTMFTRYTRTTVSTNPPSAIAEEDDHCAPDHEEDMSSSTDAGSVLGAQLDPNGFTPIDLMLILSVPSAASSSSFDLKLRLIKSTLEFIIANVGPRARISVVTYSAGEGTKGVLRKTPFLHVGKRESRARLGKVVEELGQEEGDEDGAWSMIDHKEDRVNVVTAVNLGACRFDFSLFRQYGTDARDEALDIVLQRHQKSALTGMIL